MPWLVLISIVIMILTFSIAYIKKDIVELAVLGLTGFFCVYAFSSALLFWCNHFSIARAVWLTTLFSVFICILVAVRAKRKPGVTFHLRQSLIPMAAFAILFIVTSVKFGYFGMGQDQGVYQVKALALICGYNDNYFTFEEYNALTDENDIDSYTYEMGQSLVGFYGYDPKESFLDAADFPSKMTGVLHGVPVFAAVLALYGKLFGFENMAYVQTLISLCAVFLMYYVMRNLKIKKLLRFSALLVCVSSSLILWSAKSTLTEMFIMMLVMLYLYFLMDKNYPDYAVYSCIPLVMFSFYHITIYTIMPMLVIIYWALYYMCRDKRYLYANLVTLAGYLAGFFMMRSCAAVYTYGNYKKIYVLGIDDENLVLVVVSAVVVTTLITLGMIFAADKQQERFREKVVDGIRRHMRLVCRILLVVSMVCLVLTFMNTKMDYRYSTFYAYIISTGIIAIPVLFLVFLYRPQFITAHKDHLALTIMFVYMVIMYSCIFKPSIAYYYYYGRYIVPYIPVILILVALRISRADDRFRFFKTLVPLVTAILFAVLMLPYNIALTTQKDMTNMDWRIVRDMEELFEPGDAVIIDGNLASTMKFPVKVLTGADTYPVAEDLREQIARLEQGHKKVYYLTTTEWFLFKNYQINNIYASEHTVWYDASETDEGRAEMGAIPFAQKFARTIQQVNVFDCKSELD